MAGTSPLNMTKFFNTMRKTRYEVHAPILPTTLPTINNPKEYSPASDVAAVRFKIVWPVKSGLEALLVIHTRLSWAVMPI